MYWFLLACDAGEKVEVPSGDTDTATTATTTQPVWDFCPDASAYIGDESWSGSLEAAPSALYCSASNEVRTLPEELLYKAQLRVVEGTWKLPTTVGQMDLRLPLCIQRANGHPDLGDAGFTSANPQSFGGTTYTYLEGSQPLVEGSTAWKLDHTLVMVGAEGANPDPLLLNGQENDANAGSGASFTLYLEGDSPYDKSAMPFSPCMDPTWADNLHTVQFDGGEVAIDLYLGEDPIITAPGNFHHASGTLDGTAFDISDFFQLVYRPGHHHMDRHFAVIFDAPIGNACALLIENIDMQEGTTTATVHTADCSLTPLEERVVSKEDWVVQ